MTSSLEQPNGCRRQSLGPVPDAPVASARPSTDISSPAGSNTPSEEDYDENVHQGLATAVDLGQRPGGDNKVMPRASKSEHATNEHREKVSLDGDDLDVLQKSFQQLQAQSSEKSPKLSISFTKQFSAFDRRNTSSANSPFYGWYNLFWLGITLFVFKISIENWQTYGNPFGPYHILAMFRRDVVFLLFADGVMCAFTGVSWIIQLLVYRRYLAWNGRGWIVQHAWQLVFISSVVGLAHVRDWPWTHTIYFVLHGLVMLMKQHSYAFYNGHLSTLYARRQRLLSRLETLKLVDPFATASSTGPRPDTISKAHLAKLPSALQRRRSVSQGPQDYEAAIDRISKAIDSGQDLDYEQTNLFERIMKWEVDALTDELKGTSNARSYPSNLTFKDHFAWIPKPTLVYEIAYPENDAIDWYYVGEKVIAIVGLIFVMVQLSQYSIYPIVMQTVEMKEKEMALEDRLSHLPELLLQLLFPLIIEYLLSWFLIFESVLNILAELTLYADRRFYDAWWNSASWDEFARTWNRPVHLFLLRHVYHSSISAFKVNKKQATIITFFLSACVHELVMYCLFKKLRGYLLVLQMCQLPLVQLSRTKFLRNRTTTGNVVFWFGIVTGPSTLCLLYLII